MISTLLWILLIQQVRYTLPCEADIGEECVCDDTPRSSYDYHLSCPSIKNREIDVEVSRYKRSALIICNETSPSEHVFEIIKKLKLERISRIKLQDCPKPVERTLQDVFSTLGIHQLEYLELTSVKEFNTRLLGNISIKHLHLKYIDKLVIEDDSLGDNIKDLLLSNIKNVETESSPFKTATNLKRIKLYNSKISLISGMFDQCQELQQLYLNLLQLKTLPSGLFDNLVNLQLLSLSSNSLQSLHQDILRHNTNLTRLHLDNNHLKHLPEGVFSSLEHVREVSMRGNCLESLPQGLLTYQKKLTSFTMVSSYPCPNKLILPSSVFNSFSLRSVNMRNFPIETVASEVLKGCDNLEELRIQSGKIKTVGQNLFSFTPKIKQIDFVDNEIEELKNLFINLPSLEDLRLNSNKINDVRPEHFRGTNNLKSLELNSNEIEEIEEDLLANLVAVKNLDLSENRLQIFPNMKSLINLEDLKLGKNSIQHFPLEHISTLRKLNRVDLHGNVISGYIHINTTFPASSEMKLNLAGNQLNGIKMELRTRSSNKLTLDLRDNNLKCDCFADLVKQNLINDSGFSVVGDFNCFEGKSLQETDSNHLVCPAEMMDVECPGECQCLVNNFSKYVSIKCVNSNLTNWRQALDQFSSYKIDLHFENIQSNNIDFDLSGHNINKLHLSDINIHNLHLSPDILKNLIMSHSNIRSLSADTIKLLNESAGSVQVHNTQFECSCNNKDLFNLLRSNANIIKNNVTFQCSSDKSRDLHTLTIEDLCNENSFLQSLLIILLLFIIIMITLFTVIILKRDIIIIYIFSKSWGKYFFSEDRVDKDKLYDVFISYAHQDSNYVEHQLLPGLETPEYDHDPQFKCCLHSRDWLPGECIPDQILHSVENSRRTIIILSHHYLDSMWSNMEFRAAHSKALEENFQVKFTSA